MYKRNNNLKLRIQTSLKMTKITYLSIKADKCSDFRVGGH